MYSNAIVRMLIAVILLVPALVVALEARGFVRSIDDDADFIAVFTIDDTRFYFRGYLTPPIPILSKNAKLTYDGIEQLVDSRDLNGEITNNNIFLRFGNGPVISGIIDGRGYPKIPLSGSGFWDQDKNWSQERPHCRALLVQ
ncbi:hypothetical protein BGZ49_008857, partial [Haplosporangium sp. Z 27]